MKNHLTVVAAAAILALGSTSIAFAQGVPAPSATTTQSSASASPAAVRDYTADAAAADDRPLTDQDDSQAVRAAAATLGVTSAELSRDNTYLNDPTQEYEYGN
jgi:hypothetical protein